MYTVGATFAHVSDAYCRMIDDRGPVGASQGDVRARHTRPPAHRTLASLTPPPPAMGKKDVVAIVDWRAGEEVG